MRPFEVLIPIALAGWLFWPGRPRPLWISRLPLAGLVLAILHLFFEGYRWQMVPLYGLVLVLALVSAWEVDRPAPPPRRVWQILGLLLGGVVLVLGVALPVVFPIPRLAVPDGPYPVGTITLDLVDDSREEIFAPEPGHPRRLLVQIWYPAEPAPGAELAPWMDGAEQVAPAISAWIGMPPFFLDHLVYARSNSYKEAPLAQGGERFPLVHFSHGWGGFRAQSTFLMEKLASYGYVVVSTEHPYIAVTTVFPDGTVIAYNPNAMPLNGSQEEYDAAANRLIRQWAADIAFVLDTLAALDQTDPTGRFTGRLDVERVGVAGHSTGGGAVVEFCARDMRCKAGLGLDAWLGPVSKEVLVSGPTQPFFFLNSELWESDKNRGQFQQLLSGMPNNPVRLDIAGTDRYDMGI